MLAEKRKTAPPRRERDDLEDTDERSVVESDYIADQAKSESEWAYSLALSLRLASMFEAVILT